MSTSVNGQSCVPPGFRFHPTEEELLNYYLGKKVASEEIDLDIIDDVDLNKLEPWDIQERCEIGSGPQNDWYFFSRKDKKYPTGRRTNRATAAGFWKATGRDKSIYNSVKRIGMRKTLVFYKGRAPHGQKSDWIMHEYRLDDPSNATPTATVTCAASSDDGWVVCRVFKKKHHPKEAGSSGGKLKRGRGASKAANARQCSSSDHGFMELPPLESPPAATVLTTSTGGGAASDPHPGGITDWAMMDRLVASHLDGQPDAPVCFDAGSVAGPVGGDDRDAAVAAGLAYYSEAATRLFGAVGSDDDLWSFAWSAATSQSG